MQNIARASGEREREEEMEGVGREGGREREREGVGREREREGRMEGGLERGRKGKNQSSNYTHLIVHSTPRKSTW